MSAGFSRIALDGHTLGRQSGGNEAYIRGLLHGLEAADFDGEILLYLSPDVDVSTGPGAAVRRTLRSKGALRRLVVEMPAALRRDRPDFAHFQYIGPLWSPCLVTVAIHDTSFVLAPDLLPRALALRLRRTTGLAIRGSAAVLVPSAWTAETLVDRYPDARAKIHVVPLAPVTPLDGGTAAAARLPDRFCLYVGRRQQRKNVAFLLHAYAAALERERMLPPLLLIGPRSPEDDSLRQLASALGIADRVLLRGFESPSVLAAAYRRADFFCYPCRYEGFGLPLAEAMSYGCAALAANEGGLPETAGDGAVLLPPTSVGAWTEAMVQMAADPDARVEMARRGRVTARRFDWRRTAQGLLDAARAAGI